MLYQALPPRGKQTPCLTELLPSCTNDLDHSHLTMLPETLLLHFIPLLRIFFLFFRCLYFDSSSCGFDKTPLPYFHYELLGILSSNQAGFLRVSQIS